MAKISEELQRMILSDPKSEKETEDLSVSLDEINAFGDVESIKRMFGSMASYNRMLREKITFINDDLTRLIPFTRENLYLIAAYSGNGKSTIAANVSYPLWKEGKRSLIISNEESEHDVLLRIASLELGIEFNDYKKGHMSMEDQKRCMVLFPDISKYIKVIDVNYKNGLTTKLEGIQNALTAVRQEDFSCVLIDYYQLIKFSAKSKGAKPFEVLNDLRIWLGRYIKNSNVPVVLFAQLHSVGKRGKDLDSRIKDCAHVVEPATVVIEAIPDFDRKVTSFVIHKDRFGLSGRKVECGYDRGRFVSLSLEFQKLVVENKLAEIIGKKDEVPSDS